MFNKIFKIVSVIVILCSCVFGVNAANDNPIYQTLAILQGIRDSSNNFEEISKKLDTIIPADCKVDEVMVSKEEVEFFITIWKLDFAVTLKKGERALQNAEKVAKLKKSEKVDLKKLTKLFDVDLEYISEYDICSAYVITNQSEKALNRLQNLLSKYPKGSGEYIMIRFALGTAYFKLNQNRLAIEPLKEAWAYFDSTNNKTSAAIAASNLSLAYLGIGDKENAELYRKKSENYANKTNSDMVRCELVLGNLFKMLDAKSWGDPEKIKFETDRRFILEHSQSDLQLWNTHFISAAIKLLHNYSDEEILADLENAYIYRGMIWGDGEVSEAQKFLDDLLNEMKKELFARLAKSGKTERLNYWNVRFTQKRVYAANASQNLSEQQLMQLLSRRTNALQALKDQECKTPEQRDNKLILDAKKNLDSINAQLTQIMNTLPENTRKIIREMQSEEKLLSQDMLFQLSRNLPAETACLQYILAGDQLIAYITVKDSHPIIKVTDLKSKGSSEQDLTAKIVQTRAMLQNPVAPSVIQGKLQKLYTLIFTDVEPLLQPLKVSQLLINGSGILRYVPMAALYDGKQYLLEKYQVTCFTGVDLFRLGQAQQRYVLPSMKAVIFADPDSNNPLPGGRQEGKAICQFFSNAQLFEGKAATLEKFQTLLGNVNILHLATHAKLNSQKPQESHILFANGDKWYISKMYSLPLRNLDLIVLSACETAVNINSDGSEIESFTDRLLKKSHTGSIMASFWQVDDNATAEFMKSYYQHIKDSIEKTGMLDRGGALRTAQLRLLKNAPTASPCYWAAFSLWGDFR